MKQTILTLLLTMLSYFFSKGQAPNIPTGQSFANGVGIGIPVGPNYSDAALHIKADNNSYYPSGNGQQLFYCETANAPGDYFKVFNTKGSLGNTFSPVLMGTVISANSHCLRLWGNTSIANDDSSFAPMIEFNVTKNFISATSQTSGNNGDAIQNRKLFAWSNSGNELMSIIPTSSINGDARLGLGMTSPVYKMEIATPALNLNDGLRITHMGNMSASLRLKASTGVEWSLQSSGTGNSVGAGHLSFLDVTNNFERMRINYNGFIGINTSATNGGAPTHMLHVKGLNKTDPIRFEKLNSSHDSLLVTTDTSGVLHYRNASTLLDGYVTSTCKSINYIPVVINSAGSLGCSKLTSVGNNIGINMANPSYNLDVNGSLRTVSVLVTSDKRYKTNIKALINPNKILSQLQGVTYNWKNQNDNTKEQIGFIAQDVEKVLPDIVDTDKNGVYSVNYLSVIPILTEALKNQNERVNKLEQEVLELKRLIKQK